jgi:phosphoserine phosphatase
MNPLCVDLDGTLILEDVTLLALKEFLRRNPLLNAPKAAHWLLCSGLAFLKQKLAMEIPIDVRMLSYNEKLLDFMLKRKSEGVRLFLATACDRVYAEKIADSLGIFDGVLASDGRTNLRASAKAMALATLFGEQRFSYAGNSMDDVAVWNRCSECIIVNPTPYVLKAMKNREYLLFC